MTGKYFPSAIFLGVSYLAYNAGIAYVFTIRTGIVQNAPNLQLKEESYLVYPKQSLLFFRPAQRSMQHCLQVSIALETHSHPQPG